jgi:hypothetical protein
VNGELVSEPFPGRPGVGWTATGQVVMGDPTLDADITRPDGAKQALTGLNRVAKADGDLVLFTSFYGATAQAAARGVAVVLDALPRPLRVGAQVQAVVREVREGSAAPIPPTGGVLIGTAGAAEFLRPLQPGDRVAIRIDLQGDGAERWRAVQEAVAGGPWLIRNGKLVAPDEMPGGFNPQTFIERRHPRHGSRAHGAGRDSLDYRRRTPTAQSGGNAQRVSADSVALWRSGSHQLGRRRLHDAGGAQSYRQ